MLALRTATLTVAASAALAVTGTDTTAPWAVGVPRVVFTDPSTRM
jgi:hypothetical protein